MISPPARMFRLFLRSQQPLLRRMRHPRHVALVEPALEALMPLPAGCRSREETMGGRRVLVIENRRAGAHLDRVLVYIHGGGYNVGSPYTHRSMAARLMLAGRFSRLYIPSYRLAPAHPYPAGLDDLTAFWNALTERHAGKEIGLAGESAGAGMSLALCQRLRDGRLPLPQRVFLHSPWLDVGLSGKSYHDPDHYDAFLGHHPRRRDWLHQVFARHYLGKADPAHPLVSPVHADPLGLPPLYIQAGEEEIFLDDSRTLAARSAEVGAECELEVWPGMWHAWGMLAPFIPEANRALRRAGRWLATGQHAPARLRIGIGVQVKGSATNGT